MRFYKLLTLLFSLFGLLFIGVYYIDTGWSIKNVIMYWVFYGVANIAAALWSMADSNYDVNKDIGIIDKLYKKKD